MGCRYFIVTHRPSGKEFKASNTSKNKLKKSLPRFCTQSNEYTTMWNILEVSAVTYFNKRHLPNAPDDKQY